VSENLRRCSGNKTVKLRLRDIQVLVDAFGLDRTQRAVREFCDEVDTDVGAGPVRPFVPQPQIGDGQWGERRDGCVGQPPFGEAFELLAPGVGVGVKCSK